MSNATNLLAKFAKGVIISSQASGNEPLNTPEILTALAESALDGGACGIRMAQAHNLAFFRKKRPEIPLIGLTKPEPLPTNPLNRVYITATFADVASIAPYCDIVALDATRRPRPNGETLETIVRQTRQQFPDLLLMADIATVEEGLYAASLGFDCIGTTLSGYTLESQAIQEKAAAPSSPDFALLSSLTSQIEVPVILEGRIWLPEEVSQAFQLGAHAVVVGSAVTRPYEIVRRFVSAQ
jgi:N-acylglucosamine-6-phosphate 2-epimerase